MKYFTLFLICMLAAIMLPEVSLAQAGCQPKSCSKATADKATATTSSYLTVDFKALTKTNKPSCSKKSEAKVLKVAGDASKSSLECKPCDPKDCPPECIPICCEKGKEASAKKVSQQMETSCDPNDCPPACKKHC